jgi:hypothetical protein
MVITDTSDCVLGARISQKCRDDKLYPIAHDSNKRSPADINYEIDDQELLPAVDSFKIW